jgi:hypothetical protein
VNQSSAGEKKGFRLDKKKSIATSNNSTAGTLKRRSSAKGSKKSGGTGVYNEGAEEIKEWQGDDI